MAEASFEQARQGFANPRRRASDRGLDRRARGPRFAPAPGTAADVMRLHGEFVRAQMRSLAEQAAKKGQLVSKAARKRASQKV
jgi:hypothetical protein